MASRRTFLRGLWSLPAGFTQLRTPERIVPLADMPALTSTVRVDNRLYIDGREITASVVRHLREEANRHSTKPL